MDWRDLIDERRRRALNAVSQSSTRFGTVTAPQQQPAEEDKGFFGGWNPLKPAVDTVTGVAGFFGNMVKDIYETGKTAVEGIGNVVQGSMASSDQLHKTEEYRKKQKELTDKLYAITGDKTDDATWNDPKVKEIQNQINKLALENGQGGGLTDQQIADSGYDKSKADKAKQDQTEAQKQIDEAQAVDPLKTAAASGETALNALTLGVGGLVEQGGKAVLKQGAKMVGKDIIKEGAEQAAKTAAKKVATDVSARTASGAAKRIGSGAFEGAALGGGIGFLDPYAKEGKDANIQDAWQGALLGGTIGGALGGAVPLLNRNVRAGVREIPGAVKGDIQQRIADYNALPRSVREGGYIKNPFYREGEDVAGAMGQASDNAGLAQRQLAGENISPVDPTISSYINETAAQYSSPQQYVDDLVNNLWAENKKGRGVETGFLHADPNSYDVTGRWAQSNNTPFYQAFYKEHGYAPTKSGIRDIVEQELGIKPRSEATHTNILDSTNEYGEVPFAKDIYQQLVDRENGFQETLRQGPPADMYNQFAGDLGQPVTQNADQAIPRPVSDRAGAKTGTGSFDSPEALQRALGRGEANTNNAVDFVDISNLPSPQPRVGVQQAMDTTTNPYEGMSQNLETKALPQGELPKPLSPAAAKRSFAKDGKAVEFLNSQRPGNKPIELPANVDEWKDIATRQTPAGKLKPLARNNAHITNDDVAAIRAIAEDNTSNKFTMTRTPEMNLEEALAGRGGANSKEFRTLSKFNTSIREHTAQYTDWLTEKRDWLERFIKEGNLDGAKARDMRTYLEAGNKEASDEALKQYIAAHGEDAGRVMVKLREWWRATKDIVRNETNDQIKTYAGEDRMMGDLGPTYVPRVYKSGTPGFKETFLDVAHGKMDAIGGDKGLFNLKNGTGYLGKESESLGGGVLRNSEGIPLNSEFAKPNTTYLSAAQKRTAKSPIKEMEDPLTSMMRYFEATGRAKFYTEDIARGQTLRDAIQYVNNETGNLRQMYKSFEDQVNAVAGKTSRIDRPIVDSEGGAKFVNVASKLQSRISRSTILGSANSVLAQTGQLPLIAAENGAKNFAGGMSDLMRFVRKGGDDPMAGSALMKARYPKYEELFKTSKGGRAANKGTAVIAKPFRLVEHAASELAWRSSYRRALQDGFVGKEAVQEADRITAKLIGERSPGARAALYESKALSPVSAYTLEVNQMYQVAKQYFKRDPKRAAKLVGAIWLYNQGYEAVTGNKLNADPLQATLDAGKILTDQNYLDSNGEPIGFGERLLRAGGRLGGEAIDATPLGGPVIGQLYPEQGFRIPFGGGAKILSRNEVFGDTNFGRYGGGTPLASGLSNPLLLTGIPGMAQLQRSVEGANAVNSGASMTPGGDLRFSIDPSNEELWRAILLGQYGTQAGRDYLKQQNQSLAGYYQ